MRVSSASNLKISMRKNLQKKSIKKDLQNKTTKTKASASKPQVFNISLTRNKNNINPVLFGSVKKQKNYNDTEQIQRFDALAYRSENKGLKNKADIIQQLNTKISVDYINSLYSDIGIQLGCKLKQQLQNKENILNQRNILIKIPSLQQKQCFQKIKNLINLKSSINSAYRKMQNTNKIIFYTQSKCNSSTQNSLIFLQKDYQSHIVHSFLKYFQSKSLQLNQLQKQMQDRKQVSNDKPIIIQDLNINSDSVNKQINHLKEQIAKEKRLCLRYEKQQKFLISKLYSTQIKNNQLRSSSSNLKIKNTNMKDILKLSKKTTIETKNFSPEPKRSLSLKLLKIKRYNFENLSVIQNQNQKSNMKLVRSRSTSSLNSARILQNLEGKRKENLLGRF